MAKDMMEDAEDPKGEMVELEEEVTGVRDTADGACRGTRAAKTAGTCTRCGRRAAAPAAARHRVGRRIPARHRPAPAVPNSCGRRPAWGRRCRD